MTPFLFSLFNAVRSLRALRPAPEPVDETFTPDEVARLQQVLPSDAGAALDDATWRDLMLARYTDTLAPGTSIFGRQVLYRRLRGGTDAAAGASSCARIVRLLDEPAQLDALRRTLACLRRADSEVATLLFADVQPARPAWVGHLLWLPLLLVASIACALLVSPWGWVGTGVALYYLVSVHMRHLQRIAAWTRSLHALQMLLRACALLDGSGLPLTDDFKGRGAAAGQLNRALGRASMPGMSEYADWFAAADVRHYYRTLGLVFGQRALLREVFLLCADLEADVALARHLHARTLAGLPWCWSTCSPDARSLQLDGGVHPLLGQDSGQLGGQPSGLSIALADKGAFLSGQNGVGKSTFLRMLGLNLATARAFGIAYADAACLPALPVVASLQNEDSLLGGHSLYVAELARARELLAAARGARPVICLVDEIFRGTNHEESVSAATAVIDALARHALVVVSSHNLVLGTLLAHALAPWRIVRNGAGGLRLEPGVLGRTNGVALLAAHGFDAGIQRKAEHVANALAQQRSAPSEIRGQSAI
jgi:hypothetical protein